MLCETSRCIISLQDTVPQGMLSTFRMCTLFRHLCQNLFRMTQRHSGLHELCPVLPGHEGHEGHQGHEGSHNQEQGQEQDPGHAAIAANTSTALDGHILQCQELPILALGVQAADIRQLHKVWQAMGPELAHHQAQCLGPCRTRQPNSGHFSRHQLLQQSFEEEKNGWCVFWFIMV